VRLPVISRTPRTASHAADEAVVEEVPLGMDGVQQNDMKNWTSVRMTYLLMSALLLLSAAYDSWAGVIFISFMLQVAVWFRRCPSMWFFEQAGYERTEM